MRTTLASVALTAVLAIAATVLADTKGVQDPKGDTTGGKLDLASATAGHTSTGKLKITVTQYNDIKRASPPGVVINGGNKPCNDASGPYKAYYIRGGYGDGGGLYRPACGNYQGTYKKDRPNSKTVVYTFSKKAIGSPGKFYWAIRIAGSGEGNIDVLPDKDNPKAVCPGKVRLGVCDSGWAQYMVLHEL